MLERRVGRISLSWVRESASDYARTSGRPRTTRLVFDGCSTGRPTFVCLCWSAIDDRETCCCRQCLRLMSGRWAGVMEEHLTRRSSMEC